MVGGHVDRRANIRPVVPHQRRRPRWPELVSCSRSRDFRADCALGGRLGARTRHSAGRRGQSQFHRLVVSTTMASPSRTGHPRGPRPARARPASRQRVNPRASRSHCRGAACWSRASGRNGCRCGGHRALPGAARHPAAASSIGRGPRRRWSPSGRNNGARPARAWHFLRCRPSGTAKRHRAKKSNGAAGKAPRARVPPAEAVGSEIHCGQRADASDD